MGIAKKEIGLWDEKVRGEKIWEIYPWDQRLEIRFSRVPWCNGDGARMMVQRWWCNGEEDLVALRNRCALELFIIGETDEGNKCDVN